MEEIIGRRKNSLAVGFIAIIVIGVVLGVLCIVSGIMMDEMGAVYVGIFVGIMFIALGAVQCVLFFKTPANIIVYSNGVLTLGNKGTCSPLDITGCKIIITRRNGIADRWGKVELTLADGRLITLNYVDNVKQVQERLGSLKAQVYDEIMRMQAESAPAQGPATSDRGPFGI